MSFRGTLLARSTDSGLGQWQFLEKPQRRCVGCEQEKMGSRVSMAVRLRIGLHSLPGKSFVALSGACTVLETQVRSSRITRAGVVQVNSEVPTGSAEGQAPWPPPKEPLAFPPGIAPGIFSILLLLWPGLVWIISTEVRLAILPYRCSSITSLPMEIVCMTTVEAWIPATKKDWRHWVV